MSTAPSASAAARRRHALLSARARRLSRPRRDVEPVVSVACLVCEVGDALYGVPLASALRVAPSQSIAKVPSSNSALIGVFGHAAGFFHTFDLAAMAGGSPELGGALVLLRGGNPAMALRVDRVLRVCDLAPMSPDLTSGMRPAHAAVSGFARPLQDFFEGRIVALIDPQKLSSDASGGSTAGDSSDHQ